MNRVWEAPYPPQDEMGIAIPEDDDNHIRNIDIDERTFSIRLAATERGRNEASLLISRMYATRGYNVPSPLVYGPNRITLAASSGDDTMGTVTLGVDSAIGILADETFKDEIDKYRAQGARVCEITKLAFDPQLRSKQALAALFHTLFIYARYLYGCSDMFIEVNPRHRRYYQTMLGFTQVGELRNNSRVNAPAYLLRLCLEGASRRLERHNDGTNPESMARSLYPYFFSKEEEAGIAHRLFNVTLPEFQEETEEGEAQSAPGEYAWDRRQ